MPRIQLRRDTAANWTSANPTLAAGEMGVETDTRRIKIGTGSAVWTALAYLDAGPPQVVATGGGAIADLTSGQQAVITTGTVVTTTDGRRWIYSGTGSKTSEASYIELADVTPTWDSIAGKPSTFTPATHSHAISDVTNLQSALDSKQASGSYADATHTHTVSDISDFPTVPSLLWELSDVDDNVQYANSGNLLYQSGSGWRVTNLNFMSQGPLTWDWYQGWHIGSSGGGGGGGGGVSYLYQLDDVSDAVAWAGSGQLLYSGGASGWVATNLNLTNQGPLTWDWSQGWHIGSSGGGGGVSYLYQLDDVDDNAQYAGSGNILVKSGSGWNSTNLNFWSSGALIWNGYNWEISTTGTGVAYLSDLINVANLGAGHGQVLTWDSFTSGGIWRPSDVSGAGGSGGSGAEYLYQLTDVDDNVQYASGNALLFYSGGTNQWTDTGGVGYTNNSMRAYFDDWTSPGHALVLDSTNDSAVTRLKRYGLDAENSGGKFFAVNTSYTDLAVIMSGLPTSAHPSAAGYVWVDSSGYLRLS